VPLPREPGPGAAQPNEQPSIGGHQGAAKLEHQAAVETQPNSIRSRFTPWVRAMAASLDPG
jgi:hypothetical protein